MSRILKLLGLQLLMTVTSMAFADVISLTDGTLLEGELIGKNNGIIMFRVNGEIRAFPEDQVAALVEEDQPAQAQAPTPPSLQLTVPAGTELVLSMLEDVNTEQHSVGHKFRAQLEGALVIDGVTVAPRGTVFMGVITQAQQARRASGQSELTMEFTDIIINDQLFPIATGDLNLQGEKEGANTVRRAARGAIIGGLINGSDGARDGAAIGAGVSLLTKGDSINVTRGTILETRLSVPLTVRQ